MMSLYRKSRRKGFTLVELLVVITIIGILVSVALPALLRAVVSARKSKNLSQAKGIGSALLLFAADHDNQFPSKKSQGETNEADLNNANDAYVNLLPYMKQEKPFFNKESKYCKNLTQADDNFSTDADALKAGENTYAYVSGFSMSSNPSWPILADGFKQGSESDPVYSKLSSDYGGVWEGESAIVLYVGNSAELLNPSKTTLKVMRKDKPTANLFKEDTDTNQPWCSGGTVYNPKI